VGDLTICNQCGSVLAFTETGFRAMADDEWAQAPADMKQVIRDVRLMIHRRGPTR
jgi:hypothetical protein